jgi:drug/metabolite transporter (DMT)-like permease
MNQRCFTVGLGFTSVAHSALIVSMGPIYVLLLARAHGQETITGKKLLGMALCFCGVAVLAAERGSSLPAGAGPPAAAGLAGSAWRGDLIMLSGSLGFAFYTVLGKKVAAQYDSLAMNLYNYLAAALFVLPVALWRGQRLEWSAVGWAGRAGLAYMALFASVVAYLIFYWALGHMEASRLASFSSYLLPVLATILGVVLLGERLTRHVVLGGALVLAGLYLAERARRGAPPEREVAIVQP